MKDQFYKELRQLARTPSASGFEMNIGEILLDKLEGLTNWRATDEIGNIYAIRDGQKPGAILFSAHQDKLTCTNDYGNVVPFMDFCGSNIVFYSPDDYTDAMNKRGTLILGPEGYRKAKFKKRENAGSLQERLGETLTIQTTDGGFVPEGGNSILRTKRRGAEGAYKLTIPVGVYVDVSEAEEKNEAVMNLCTPVSFNESKCNVSGKLDDALGLTLILDLLRNTDSRDTPTLVSILTVGEETGMWGAKTAVRNLYKDPISRVPIERAIIFDTTRTKKPGEGITLYEKCGIEPDFSGYEVYKRMSNPRDFSGLSLEELEDYLDECEGREVEKEPSYPGETLVADIQEFAKRHGYRLDTAEGTNDSRVFGEQTQIPTVALEVPIKNMHSPKETCHKGDIEEMRDFVRRYVTR
jgi:putative aminopeptidase FrvX